MRLRWRIIVVNCSLINTNKTKELIICFNKKISAEDIPPLCTNGGNIDRVTTFKLLGVFVSLDLSLDYLGASDSVRRLRFSSAPQIQFFSDVVRLINCYIIIIIIIITLLIY